MLELNLSENTNSQLQANGYNPQGKYYARVETKETYDLKKLARHMHQHNAAFSSGLIVGILTDMVACIKELALDGNVIKIDDLGLFKASVESNGLTLRSGAKISAGKGSQRTDAELTSDISKQQFAVGAVKLIMQATGETTKDDMTSEAKLSFTKAARDLIKSKTGNDSTGNAGGEDNGGGDGNGSGNNGGGSNNGGNSGSSNSGGSGSITTGVAAPTIGGEAAFATSTQVTMSGPDGAEIRYTTDGSTPTASSTLYTEAITVSSSVTLKAIAIKDGQSSEVTTKQFVKSDGGADDPSGFEGA